MIKQFPGTTKAISDIRTPDNLLKLSESGNVDVSSRMDNGPWVVSDQGLKWSLYVHVLKGINKQRVGRDEVCFRKFRVISLPGQELRPIHWQENIKGY